MTETDNRYPEFAAPYEPVKGGKHKKRLDFARMAMMLAGALVACSAFFKVPEPEPMPGPVIVVPSAEPTPEVTPGPTPEPTASATVEPEPSPSPTAIPYIPPKPPAPTPTTVPVTPPTPRPADPTPTPTTVPPETPTPGPTEEPVEDDVFVEIIGNQATYAYTGEEQFVRGYTYTVYVNGEEADSSLFTVTYRATDDMTYPYAAGIEPGTYEMGLTEDSFTVSSGTYDLFGVAVEDGWLRIIDEAEELNVYIYGNTSSVTYDGKAHTVSGFTYEAEDSSGAVDSSLYTVALKEGSAAQASGTYAGTYPLLTGIVDLQQTTEEDFEVTSDVYSSINIFYENGWLEILPAKTTVTIIGNTRTIPYDGEVYTVEGYTVQIPADSGLTERDIVLLVPETDTAAGKNAGTYDMDLSPDLFSLVDELKDNYEVTFAVTNGWLRIEPVTTTITVTGNTGTYTYQAGSIFDVTGYTVEIPAGINLTETDIVCSGTAAVSSGDIGRHPMGLSADQFSLTGDAAKNYNATFAVTDGWLLIQPATTTHTAPTFQLESDMSVLLSDDGGLDIWPAFYINQWNDLVNGTLTATLYISDTTGENYTAGASKTITEGSDYEYSDGEYAEVQGHLAYQSGAVYNVKIVLDYTYSDGTTGTSEIGPVTLHTDNFATLNPAYGTGGVDIDSGGFLVAEVLIDETSVETDNVEPGYYNIPVMVNGHEATGSSNGQIWLQRFTGTNRLQLSLNPGDVTRPAAVSGKLMLYEKTGTIYWISVVTIDVTIP